MAREKPPAKTSGVSDAVARVLSAVSPESAEESPRRTERINLRVTADEKVAIEEMASYLNLTVTQYLIMLHRQAMEAIEGDSSSPQ